MKALRYFILCFFVAFSLLIAACNDGGGGSGGSGTITMSVTDAKPLLPVNVSNFFVEFSEVWVHKSGGGWKQLPLVEPSYTIDLLQFQNGNASELVPPVKLESGKYTQVRIVVNSATIRFDNGGSTEDRPVEIPSENLKTDKAFIFDVQTETAVDLVIHFDLSMSVVVSGTAANPSYALKPVMHLFGDPLQAATIQGTIDNESFGDSDTAIIVVKDSTGEEYTRVEVQKSAVPDSTSTEFSIFWMVPNKIYTVQIDLDKNEDVIENNTIDVDCEESVKVDEHAYDVPLEEAEVFDLNSGEPITAGTGICN